MGFRAWHVPKLPRTFLQVFGGLEAFHVGFEALQKLDFTLGRGVGGGGKG